VKSYLIGENLNVSACAQGYDAKLFAPKRFDNSQRIAANGARRAEYRNTFGIHFFVVINQF
jgi:hypothetical protein